MKITTAARHALAILLLLLAWNRLRLWYEFLHPAAYAEFALSFLAAAALAAYGKIGCLVVGVPASRKFAAAAILALALPWGEWLQLAMPQAREDWSLQIFTQSCFIYGAALLLQWLKPVREKITVAALHLVERISVGNAVFVLIPFLFFSLTSWISLAVYHKTPLIQDSAAHLFQARVFAEGHFYAPAPRVPDAFSCIGDMLILHDGKWFSMYLPGFSLMLAAAGLIRCEWLLGPLMGAATVGIWIAYALRWHDRRTALVFGCVTFFSPMLFLMYSNVMIHMAELFFASCLLYLCRRQAEEASAARLALLAFCLFFGVITRSFSFLPFVLPALLFTLWKRRGNGSFKIASAFAAAVACSLILIALYQWKTTGNPMVAGYDLEYGRPLFYGFTGETLLQRHSPLRGLENVSNSLLGMNTWLTGWPTGTVFFLFLFALRAKVTSWDRVLLSGCLALALFYYFYVFQDLVIGPRYWFMMVPVLLFFLSRAIFLDDALLRSYTAPIAVLAFAVYLAFSFHGYIRRYAPEGNQAGQLRAEMLSHQSGKTLVLLDRHVRQNFVNWNDPFLRGNLVICRDLGAKNRELLDVYADYTPVYFREAQSVRKSAIQSRYRFLDKPDERPPGYFSLFTFDLLIQAGDAHLREDLFDLSYTEFLRGDSAADQLAYLESHSNPPCNEPKIRQNLRIGLIHLARCVLLPKLAVEEKHGDWASIINLNAFRSEFSSAMLTFGRAGDVGTPLMRQMTKLQRRMDVNDDGRFSDEEILRFLRNKLRILELRGG